MIDEAKVVELRNWRNATMGRQDGTHKNCCRLCKEAPESFKTIELLWGAVRAAIVLDRIANFGDRIYEVRDRELEGWEGPKVKEYGEACGVWAGYVKLITEGSHYAG